MTARFYVRGRGGSLTWKVSPSPQEPHARGVLAVDGDLRCLSRAVAGAMLLEDANSLNELFGWPEVDHDEYVVLRTTRVLAENSAEIRRVMHLMRTHASEGFAAAVSLLPKSQSVVDSAFMCDQDELGEVDELDDSAARRRVAQWLKLQQAFDEEYELCD